MKKLRLRYLLPIILLIVSFTIPAAAQAPAPGDGSAKRDQGTQGRKVMTSINPDQILKMITDRLKEQLGFSDEEWTVIGPKVEKVFALSLGSRGNSMRMFMGRPGAQGFGAQGPGQQGRPSMRNRMPGIFGQSGADESMEELQKLLEDKNADTDKIKALVTKVRREREKSQQELTAAKKELRELLTVRQEAMLFSMGLLD